MAEKEIKIMCSEEKLKALQFFMKQKGKDIEAELKDYLDKTYEKAVPNAVREFVESGMGEVAPRMSEVEIRGTEVAGHSEGNEQMENNTSEMERPARRYQRKNQRSSVTETETQNEAVPEQETAEAEPDETEGMAMSM